MTPLEKMDLAKSGISKNGLEELKEKADLDYYQLAQILNVARGTLISKKGQEKFSDYISERIVGLADLYSYGYEVFEDRERFNQWVFRTNKALGGAAPFDLLNNGFGIEEVRNLIGRIDYGIYS
jgi:putative toxin-antitoxin system antitoxin component (TIGR02293 family)